MTSIKLQIQNPSVVPWRVAVSTESAVGGWFGEGSLGSEEIWDREHRGQTTQRKKGTNQDWRNRKWDMRSMVI